MGRSTFEGPVLSGTNRFTPFRNVGSVDLTQEIGLVLTNTTANTANYGGSSGQFVTASQLYPNTNATVYTPSASATTLTATSIPADSATQIYRGAVMYLPAGSSVTDFLLDVGVVPTVTAGTISTITVYVSNNYTAQAGTPTYAATGTISAVGRQSLATFTGTQLANQFSTSTDITAQAAGVSGVNFSQLVFTISIAGTSMTSISAGTLYFTVRYSQLDNTGNATTYPYGNVD
jgi:hypothetical protein